MREVHTCQSKGGNFSYSNVLKAGNSGLARTVRNKTGSKRGKRLILQNVVNFSQGSVIRVLNVKFLVLGFIQCVFPVVVPVFSVNVFL